MKQKSGRRKKGTFKAEELDSDEKLALEMGMSVSKLNRMIRLSEATKDACARVDNGSLHLSTASAISFLKPESQDEVLHLMDLGYKVKNEQVERMKKADKAGKLDEMTMHDEYGGSLQDLVNLTFNLDYYDLLPDVKSDEDYGHYLVDTYREFFLPKTARLYFNYESYGECTAINEGGCYTPQGYIFNNRRTPFKVIYDGQHVPEQYKVFRYPIQQKIRAARSGRSRDSPNCKR